MQEFTKMSDENRDGGGIADKARAVRRGFISFAVFFLLMAASMFLAADKFDWTPGWVFLGVYLLTTVVVVLYLRRTNPEVLVARSQFHWRDQTPAHKVIFILLVAFFMLIFPVAGLDAGRFHGSAVPLWLAIVGYVLFSIGNAGMTLVLRANKFAEPSVSIQTDRGHKVIDTGPYAVVRHPLYAIAFFLCLGMPLTLRSYWAFIPSALGYLTIIVRTAMEDRLLYNDLPGYKDYAARVRYRLIPGVW
jgi:protein-S-isoprenylcysteine O-methyltransferase Ste14